MTKDPSRNTHEETQDLSARGLHRRELIQLISAAPLALSAVSRVQAASPRPASPPQATELPSRGEFVIRGGHVLTMDSRSGDYPTGDVHVRGGEIVAVGEQVDAPHAEVVDARDMIVMPGFIETHWHLWNSFLRGSVRGEDPIYGYIPTCIRVGRLCTPQDAYTSVRFGVAEGLMSGITTVNNFSHNTRTPQHADAEIQALLDTGVRARFSYGYPREISAEKPMDWEDVGRLQRQWPSKDRLLTLGVNLRSPPPNTVRGQAPYELFVAEMAEARRLGLPISIHYGSAAHGLVEILDTNRLLGPDLLLMHPQGFTPDERHVLVAGKVKFSTSPMIETSYSFVRNGYIQFAELEELGAQLSLSIDASSASATADFFNVMRTLLWAQMRRTDTRADTQFIPTPRRIVALATIDGARTLNIDKEVGSLTPGKRADIILVRTTDPNMAPVFDPYNSLVYSGQPANVDTVIVDGRLLRRGGKFTAFNVDSIVRDATTSARRIDGESAAILKINSSQ